MACSASPVHAIGCLCFPLTVINVGSGEEPIQSVFVSFPLSRWATDNSQYSLIGFVLSSWRHVSPKRSCFVSSMTAMPVTLAISRTSMLVDVSYYK